MFLIPSKQQWRRWSLPSKFGVVGTWLAAIGLLLSVVFFLIPYLSHSDPEGERIEELISVLDARAARLRTELGEQEHQAEISEEDRGEISEFLSHFNELHQKHIAALRARNFALAHEVLISIHKLEYDLFIKSSGRYALNLQNESMPPRFPTTNYYLSGDKDSTTITHDLYGKDAIKLYDAILKSGGFGSLPKKK